MLGVALPVTVLVPPAQAAFPGSNGKIAFNRDFEIYTINPDGSGLTNLIGRPTAAA